MSHMEFDPDELDRAAGVLQSAREQIAQQSRRVRGAVHEMHRFKGQQADRFRAETDQLAKQLDRDSQEAERLGRALKNLATQLRQIKA